MEYRKEHDKMDEVRNSLWAVLNALRATNKDGVMFVATLLYLRKQNALSVVRINNLDKDVNRHDLLGTFECLSYDKAVVEKEKNKVFRDLLEKVISDFENFFREGVSPVIDFAHVLVDYVFSEEELLDILDLATRDSRGRIGESYIPRELTNLVSFMLDKNSKNIFNPFGGRLDFATTLKDREFCAFERDESLWELGMFRVALAGILENTHYFCYRGWITDIDAKFDAIVTMPPFGVKDCAEEYLDEWALRRFEKLTKEQGQLITVVPMSILYRGGKTQELRKTIIKNNWLEAIVYLPSNIFLPFTGISVAVIVLSKKRKGEDKIRIVDAVNCFTTKDRHNVIDVETIIKQYKGCEDIISNEEILQNNSSWDLRWYFEQKKSTFREGYTVVKVGDVLMQLPTESKYEDKSGYVVSVGDLSSDVFSYEKKPEEFTRVEDLGRVSKITVPVILLSQIRDPKPTYCEASKSAPIFIKNDVVAYRIVNGSIHPGYLCMELAKRLKSYKGAVIPRLSKYQILNTHIEFPSLNEQRSFIEQKNLFEEAKQTEHMAIVREKGLEDVIERLKEDHLKSIRARKHAMMQNTSSLALAWSDLLDYLKTNNGDFNPDDKIGRKHCIRVGELINTISTNIKIINNQTLHLTEIEYDWGVIDEFYIQEFISAYINENKSTIFRYEFDPNQFYVEKFNDENGEYERGDGKPNWKVRMPKNALRQVIDNIISNAVSHGFTHIERDYCIRIEYYYKMDDIVVEIFNNGEPMHKEVDTEFIKTYGCSTKLNANNESEGKVHSGIGGNQIDNILSKYNATYEVYSTPHDEFTVCYRILFHDVIQEKNNI